MVTVIFFHESLPPGGLTVRLPVVPQKDEAVYLNETSFVVGLVNHVVYSDTRAYESANLEPHQAFVYLLTKEEYLKQMTGRGPN